MKSCLCRLKIEARVREAGLADLQPSEEYGLNPRAPRYLRVSCDPFGSCACCASVLVVENVYRET